MTAPTSFPQEVEEILLAHPAVAAAGVIGIHDRMHGENVRAYVVTKTGLATPPSGADLVRFARERIGYKAPEDIVFLAVMPLNPAGKVDRVALKRIAAEGHGTEVVVVPTPRSSPSRPRRRGASARQW